MTVQITLTTLSQCRIFDTIHVCITPPFLYYCFLPNILPKFGRLSLNFPITLCFISSALWATDDPIDVLLPIDWFADLKKQKTVYYVLNNKDKCVWIICLQVLFASLGSLMTTFSSTVEFCNSTTHTRQSSENLLSRKSFTWENFAGGINFEAILSPLYSGLHHCSNTDYFQSEETGSWTLQPCWIQHSLIVSKMC